MNINKINELCKIKICREKLFLLLLLILFIYLSVWPALHSEPHTTNQNIPFKEYEIFLESHDLTGMIVTEGQQRHIAWIFRKEGYLVADGHLYDANGQDLTAANAWRLANVEQKTPASPPEQIQKLSLEDTLKLAPKLSGFEHFGGDRRHILYAFFDPDCSGCEKSMRDVDGMAEAFRTADADIRWIPVTILGTDRTRAGRALMAGRKQATDIQPDAAILEKIDVNTAALVYALERPAVPYFIWDENGEPGAYIGTPSQKHWNMILDSWKETK